MYVRSPYSTIQYPYPCMLLLLAALQTPKVKPASGWCVLLPPTACRSSQISQCANAHRVRVSACGSSNGPRPVIHLANEPGVDQALDRRGLAT